MDRETPNRVASDSTSSAGEPDAHGRAALLLVESLVHGLIAGSVISVAEALEIVDVAAEVSAEDAIDEAPGLITPTALIRSISSSLRLDLRVD